jgi:hypothetical protein
VYPGGEQGEGGPAQDLVFGAAGSCSHGCWW